MNQSKQERLESDNQSIDKFEMPKSSENDFGHTQNSGNFDNTKNWLMLYANIIINNLILLIIVIFLNFVILRGLLGLSVVWTFILVFFIISLASPFFSKLNFGTKIMTFYFSWLERNFNKK
jgi:magnesium-transporting ATPase (P-type)